MPLVVLPLLRQEIIELKRSKSAASVNDLKIFGKDAGGATAPHRGPLSPPPSKSPQPSSIERAARHNVLTVLHLNG